MSVCKDDDRLLITILDTLLGEGITGFNPQKALEGLGFQVVSVEGNEDDWDDESPGKSFDELYNPECPHGYVLGWKWHTHDGDCGAYFIKPITSLAKLLLRSNVRELFLDRDHESFVRSIEQMNQMYRLQVSTIPTLTFVDNKSDGSQHTVSAAKRLEGFKKTLLDEIAEIDPIIQLAKKLSFDVAALRTHEPDAVFVGGDGSKETQQELLAECRSKAIDGLTAVSDVLADVVVFCVSEMRKFGLPPAAIMAIVMQSNMSKLQPDGSAKYDDNGKFLKGPNYFPPEPKLKELITELLEGHDPL